MDIVIFLAILSLLVFVHELGHFLLAKRAGIKVEEFGFGFPPRLLAVRRGETEYSINLIPLGGFTKMLGEENPAEPRSFARAKKRWRVAILSAGSLMNILLAIVLFAGAYMVGWPTATATEVQIFRVADSSPAAAAGLQEGDLVLSLAGAKISSAKELKERTHSNLGRMIPIVVKRGDQQVTLNIQPRTTWPSDQGPLGVGIWDKPTKIEPVAYDPLRSLAMGAQRTGEVIVLTLSVPMMILRGQLPAELARPVGPIGIYQVTSQAAAATADTGWFFPLLNVAAVFSAGLGLANLLPIPGLDGGRLLFVLIEAVRGKRISPEREGLIHFAGLVLLVSLMVLISYFDLLFPIAGVDWTP